MPLHVVWLDPWVFGTRLAQCSNSQNFELRPRASSGHSQGTALTTSLLFKQPYQIALFCSGHAHRGNDSDLNDGGAAFLACKKVNSYLHSRSPTHFLHPLSRYTHPDQPLHGPRVDDPEHLSYLTEVSSSHILPPSDLTGFFAHATSFRPRL
jgi:hypothetical protein